jgi:6-pyruvoyltetrahydropterin/6-carboxytetrahydropterin synthase
VYETGTAVVVRAFHTMPGLPPPEGERHSHDYRLEVVVSREDLDERGMVVDLDVLQGALDGVVAQLADADLDEVIARPEGVDAVTVERFADWLHARLGAGVGPLPGATVAVRVWESAVAFGGRSGPVAAAAM